MFFQLFWVIFFGWGTDVVEAVDPCYQPGVYRLQLSLNPHDPESKSFEYAYQLKRATLPKIGTVVYLRGGPGGRSIETQGRPFPSNLDVIYIDPRGSGCNAHVDTSWVDTSKIAGDVLEVIRHLELKSYAISGSSYGTVIATHLAYQIEADQSLVNPNVVLFEGALTGAQSVLKYVNRVHEFTQGLELPPEMKQDVWDGILNNKPSQCFGFACGDWFSFYRNQAVLGHFYPSYASQEALQEAFSKDASIYFKNPLEQWALLWKSNDTRVQMEEYAFHPDRGAVHSSIELRVNQKIQCTELLSAEDDESRRLMGCSEDSKQQLALFYASKFQLKAPLLYIHGTHDVATPVLGALEHFSEQMEAQDKLFVEIEEAGHMPLQVQLGISCEKQIWNEVFESRFGKKKGPVLKSILKAIRRCNQGLVLPWKIKFGKR